MRLDPILLFPIGLLLIGAALFVVGGVTQWQRERHRELERESAYEAFSALRGLHYRSRPVAESTWLRANPYPAWVKESPWVDMVSLFEPNIFPQWRHEITGKLGDRPFIAFEYRYSAAGGDESTSTVLHVLSMIKWQEAKALLPGFTLTPERFFDRVEQWSGLPDIDFDEDPVFSKIYTLKGLDEAPIRALFVPELRASLCAKRDHNLAGSGSTLFWWRKGSLPGPDDFDAFLAAGSQVANLVFRY